MRFKTFRGGIHPPDFKRMTKELPIRKAALPLFVRIPLKQNAGSPPRLLVEEGQYIKTGEKIAEPSGAISVPLHSSISGTIKGIAPRAVPYGGGGVCIDIEGDGKDEKGWSDNTVQDPLALSREDILKRIRDAGVVGLGGAEFPTYFKLSPPPEKKVEQLIINGAECEPYLTVDHRIMLEKADEVIAGTQLLMKAAGISRAIVGIEKNKRDAYEAIVKAAGGMSGIEVVLLKVKYPQGAERQLISAILKREVPSGGLPADVGVIVQNVGTAVAVYEACRFGKPLYERVITVSGSAVREPGNLLVRIGTLFSDIVEQCGGVTDDAKMLIMGGPMMGMAQWTMDVPVVKGTTGIVILAERDLAWPKPHPCIRCGRCLQICPMRLAPALMRAAAEKGRWEDVERYGVMECIECGACAYVCPSSRDQVQLYKRAKDELGKRNSEPS